MKEWEIITADERNVLEERVDAFIDNMILEGYEHFNTETHYSTKNIQWETLVIFT